jgi:hypothetical protein
MRPLSSDDRLGGTIAIFDNPIMNYIFFDAFQTLLTSNDKKPLM